MAAIDEEIVREYFEQNGFFVRQVRKYQVTARKKKLFMRDAAYVIAINRVAQACKDRGWV